MDGNDDNIESGSSSLFLVAISVIITEHSTISQSAASTQLQRKRLLDVASRSLAQLATASRHSSTKCCSSSRGDGSGDRTRPSNGKSSNDDGISPDFDPPSTQSLLA